MLECTMTINRSSSLPAGFVRKLPKAAKSKKPPPKKPESPPRVTVVLKASANSHYRRAKSPPPAESGPAEPEVDPLLAKITALISGYSSIPIGSTVSVVGVPRPHFSGGKCSLQVDKVMIEKDPMAESAHRKKVKELRTGKYAGLFRLDEEWKDWREATTKGTNARETSVCGESRSSTVSPKAKVRVLYLKDSPSPDPRS